MMIMIVEMIIMILMIGILMIMMNQMTKNIQIFRFFSKWYFRGYGPKYSGVGNFPPLFGQCLKENVFFLAMCSLIWI